MKGAMRLQAKDRNVLIWKKCISTWLYYYTTGFNFAKSIYLLKRDGEYVHFRSLQQVRWISNNFRRFPVSGAGCIFIADKGYGKESFGSLVNSFEVPILFVRPDHILRSSPIADSFLKP